uniref:Flap endonuclease 1 n=1 Tax=Staphylothermus marinus TaxID=2280 RepID=A0A7C4JLP4_STAMA
MGVNLKDLIPDKCRVVIDDLRVLKGKTVAIDAYNALYQFLAAIRQPDGTPLMDSKGRVTSHLSGLFYRTINIVEEGVKPVYVFDGKPPEMKAEELRRRSQVKEEASKKYEEAVSSGDLEAARKYAMISSKLTDTMVYSAKKLLDAMGIPYVEALSEGEAQAAYLVINGDAWATASQDYDSLLFGSPRLLRNLTISGKRKLPGREEYIEVKPEIIELDNLLKELGIKRDQLIDIAILIGTDYNPDGVKGIGLKTAYKLIKEYGSLEKIPKALLGNYSIDELINIKSFFINPPVNKNYKISWNEPDQKKIIDILVNEYDFSEDRVKKAVERLVKAYRENLKARQLGLDMWFTKKT